MKYTEKIIDFAKNNANGMYWISVVEDGVKTTEQISPSNKTNNSYSVAKIFTVTAIGMLVDEKKLSTEEKVVDIFKDDLVPDMDKKWHSVTVDMVMRHSFGLSHGFLDIDCENPNNFDKQYGSNNDYLKNVFSIKLPNSVNTDRQYSDGAYYLLSRIVAKKAGMDLYDYLQKKLFIPMRFEEVAWSKCPQGYSMGATGLYIRTSDMVKLGQLYLDKGVFEGVEYISKEWCNTVIEKGYELRGENGVYAKGGMNGQYLYVDYNRNLTIAWHGFYINGEYQSAMLNYLNTKL